MDTKTLITDAKARFSHNSAKAYLKDKYSSKLIVADQGGLWTADQETIAFLSATDYDQVVLIDNFNNPVKVDRKQLSDLLHYTYVTVMEEWHQEWTQLENNR